MECVLAVFKIFLYALPYKFGRYAKRIKVFYFFFSKKKRLLPSPAQAADFAGGGTC